MLPLFVCGVLFLALFNGCIGYSGTPLDDYIALQDNAYSYSLINSSTESYGTIFNLQVTSQIYQDASFSDQVLWKHNLQLCVPNTPLYEDHAFLMIAGGDNGEDFTDGRLPYLPACAAGIISSAIFQIPNQPLKFPDQSESVLEDDIVAHTLRSFLNESEYGPTNPSQIVLFAMAKAAVRAMDTVQDFLLYNYTSQIRVSKFVVSGASKRGWTAWLTCAADERVVAIMPIVIPLLNFTNNILTTWRQLDDWGFALGPYTNQKLFDFTGLPEMGYLADQIDPLSYNDRYENIKKLIVDSSNDQFFLVDGPKFFWDSLKGPKWLTTIPNTEHSMAHAIARNEISPLAVTFFRAVAENVDIPSYSWSLHYSNSSSDAPSVTITTPKHGVIEAKQWSCTTNIPGKRDFRFQTCELKSCYTGLTWVSSTSSISLSIDADNNYLIVGTLDVSNLNVPNDASTQLWTAFLVQVNFTVGPFEDGTSSSILLTSLPNIFPDFYPFDAYVPDYAAIDRVPASTSSLSSFTSSFFALSLFVVLSFFIFA